MRQMELKLGEGIPGYLAERRIAGFGIASWSKKDSPNRPVFDRGGIQIGEVPPLPDDKRGKTPTGAWLSLISEEFPEMPIWLSKLADIFVGALSGPSWGERTASQSSIF